ncbi:MAG: response regulator [Candidatus Omnitrophica bacterium]|nr:response regulator [Candidatus Omnitrophota bacterium]
MIRALVVDDEEEIAVILKETLEELGAQTRMVHSGDAALKIIESEALDLLVCDMRLSTKISGLDLISAAKKKSSKTLVASMTGYVDIALQQAAEKLGVDLYLMKPDDLKPEIFEQKIRTLLAKFPKS